MNPTPSTPNTPKAPGQYTESQLREILSVAAEVTRWRILSELHKGEALPVGELSRRLGIALPNISKHCARLLAAGITQRTYGQCYKITPAYLIPDQNALDLGPILLRLDSLPAK